MFEINFPLGITNIGNGKVGIFTKAGKTQAAFQNKIFFLRNIEKNLSRKEP
jgi:hypothetical protein